MKQIWGTLEGVRRCSETHLQVGEKWSQIIYQVKMNIIYCILLHQWDLRYHSWQKHKARESAIRFSERSGSCTVYNVLFFLHNYDPIVALVSEGRICHFVNCRYDLLIPMWRYEVYMRLYIISDLALSN